MDWKRMFKSKRGVFDNLTEFALGVLLFVMTSAVGVLILAQVRTNGSIAASTNATATVDTGINAVQSLAAWTPIVIVVGVGAVIIGLLMMYRRGGAA